jgi:hypothetical protein
LKVLAIIEVAAEARPDHLRAGLIEELKASWDLFAAGALREAYATEAATRVVFVLEAFDAEDARRILGALPLIADGTFRVDLIELRPFRNWSLLFAG